MTARVAFFAVALFSRATPAQILSPGPLGRAHAQLEGLGRCTSCHELGEALDGDRCLACHQPLADRMSRGGSFHNRVASQACTSCHQDHEGRNAKLSDWGGPRAKFDHGRTGWSLTGKHRELGCESCHRALLARPAALKARLQKRALSTYLGLGRQCAACHFDEHRGQLGGPCANCHDTQTFVPAPGFVHGKSWQLRGAHARLECAACHRSKPERASFSLLPPVDADAFTQYKIGRPRGCATCHRDVHRGKFGRRCERCHDENSWHRLQSRDVGFHDQTRFPLRGKHRTAACETCHPPAAGGGMKTRGLSFGSCGDCHLDAHLGQIQLGADSCAGCHDESGFYPPRYPLDRHQATPYPLHGAHRVVACSGCHIVDEAELLERVPKRLRGKEQARGHELINFSRFDFNGRDLGACATCHQDIHGGQFASEPTKECGSCHRLESFHQVALDHDRDTAFPLRGRHAGVSCDRCHLAATGNETVVYRGAPRRCEVCHQGYHRGQFAGARDCGECHDTKGFSPPRFGHETVFALDGAHEQVPCERCHPTVGGPDQPTHWYRGVPSRCEGCHENIHQRTASGRKLIAEADAGCSSCHRTSSWHHVQFDHDNTRLPLRGRHASLSCRACHDRLGSGRMDPRCGSCHLDPHAGRLGAACERCHEATSFRDGLGVTAHDQTRFPLYGRHALVPCDECHQAQNDAGMGGVPSQCDACHEDAYLATAGGGLDHAAAGIGRDCQRCHGAVAWRLGVLPEHDRCFPLTRGPHRGLGCLECHTAAPGVAVDGSCDSFNASCTRCHSCARMDDEHTGEGSVAGYQCADRKCYECHPAGTEDG